MSKKVLLHICCGICAAGAVKRLQDQNYEIIGFFYNPNIHPVQEYNRRLGVLKKVKSKLDFNIIESIYNKDDWFSTTSGLEDEPEGGKRCKICFRMRLDKTWQYFKEGGFDYFTTTLTISSHKNSNLINSIGKSISPDFLSCDFKKKNGFKEALEITQPLKLYRQNYCGCIYSKA